MKLPTTVLGITAVFLLNSTSFAQTPKVVSLRDDNQFNNQDFSQQLFGQIPQGEQACKAYRLVTPCSYKLRHIFKDAVLITEKETTAGITITIIPKKPISKQQALSYAKIIDAVLRNLDSEKINFTKPDSQSKKMITYIGCPLGGNPPDEFLCFAQLHLTSNGTISRIVVISQSP